jgi:hypothetical protein
VFELKPSDVPWFGTHGRHYGARWVCLGLSQHREKGGASGLPDVGPGSTVLLSTSGIVQRTDFR